MASILELLDETMLASALRGQQESNGDPSTGERLWQWVDWPAEPSKPERKFTTLKREPFMIEHPIDTRAVPIWHYTEPTITGGKVEVKDLTCLVSGMEYMRHTVCDSIEWGPLSFCADNFDGDASLPLAQDFLIRREFAREGVLEGTDRFWKLPLKTDLSFDFVFGFQFPWNSLSGSWSATPEPLKNVCPEPASFIEMLRAPFGDEKTSFTLHPPECPGSNTLRYSPPQIIVVVTLVCCKEADYGLLNAARFFPMIMVASNIELNTLRGAVQLTRPKSAAMQTMQREKMTADNGTLLFTDRNEQDGKLPSVAWDQSFEYYDLDPSAGSYVLAYPKSDITKGARTLLGVKVKSYDVELKRTPVSNQIRGDSPLLPAAVVKTRYVNKESRQGEFDNLHIAPRMILEQSQLKSNYGPSIAELAPTFGSLDSLEPSGIAMAPFCVHDCLHMHVRWATWPGKNRSCDPTAFAPVNFRGWDGDLLPNAIPGAPMVPANQKVTLNLKSRPQSPGDRSAPLICGFEYVAEAESAKAGKWQIIMHHGASYSLSGIWRGDLARLLSS
ncbi:MAG: hypothetical protein H7Y20_18495, partial [Bryobacteraceae bacterium]|nr:hypothetical protein [Bryobacteraceae bacterium]